MSSATAPTVAFFGATGGCTFVCLMHTIRAGINCAALARTPSKLTALLKSQGLDEPTINAHLTIVPGNAHDVVAVRQTLTSSGSYQHLVDTIVSGLGPSASFKFQLRAPLQFFNIDDPSLCTNASKTLLAALREIYAAQPALKAQKPLVSFISTAGITRGPEDVPLGTRLLYRHVLTPGLMDKRNMENVFRDNADGKDGDGKLIRTFIGVRPSLLMGTTDVTDAAGLHKVRAGLESKPAIGYTIKRADVGEWIFKNVVQSEGRGAWEGQMVSLTS